MGNFVVVRLLQCCDVAVTSGYGVCQRDNATAPACASQAGPDSEILRNVDELIEVAVAALIESFQRMMRFIHQLR